MTDADELAERQHAYAQAWAEQIVRKKEADARRHAEQPLEYYIRDGIRRIMADLGIVDPSLRGQKGERVKGARFGARIG